jgi:hypothetical protein
MTTTLRKTFFTSAGMLLAFEVFLRVSGWQAEFAESNLQANLIRIAAYEFEPVPENLILGSSLSGRLLPKFFAQHGQSFGNLALDGAGVPLGLELVTARKEKPARLFLEVNTLFFRSVGNERILTEAMANPVFQLGRYLWLFRPGSRPSAFLYSWLKKVREEKESGVSGEPPSGTAEPAGEIPARELKLLRQLQRDGVEIFIVTIPSGRGETEPPAEWQAAAEELGARWIRPRNRLREQGADLRYTDGLHLDRPSAQKVVQAIEVEIPGWEPR